MPFMNSLGGEMKKLVLALSIVSILFMASSCSHDAGIINKGSVTGISFKVGADSNNNYVLSDHKYTTDDYKVLVSYSSNYREYVTDAKIEGGEYMTKSSDGSLTFSSANTSHEFTVKVTYGGKAESFKVHAYKAEDIISLQMNEKFFEGCMLGTIGSSVKISYLNSSGELLSDMTPSDDCNVKFYNASGNETFSGTYGTIRGFKTDDTKVSFSIKDSSEGCSSAIEIIPKTQAQKVSANSISSLKDKLEGKEINLDSFVKTYLQNYRVKLYNGETEKSSDVISIVYITDAEGKIADGYKITVTAKRGESDATGTFEVGDIVSVVVSIDNSSIVSSPRTCTVEATPKQE